MICRWGVVSFVDEGDNRQEEAIFMVRGFGPGGPQSPARGVHLKEFVSR